MNIYPRQSATGALSFLLRAPAPFSLVYWSSCVFFLPFSTPGLLLLEDRANGLRGTNPSGIVGILGGLPHSTLTLLSKELKVAHGSLEKPSSSLIGEANKPVVPVVVLMSLINSRADPNGFTNCSRNSFHPDSLANCKFL